MDKEYWNQYYQQHLDLSQGPSAFARLVASQVDKNTHGRIIDIGCGNGRDTYFFAENGIQCTGIDQCDMTLLEHRAKSTSPATNCAFLQRDFTSCDYDDIASGSYSIYSRFTLHAINYAEEDSLFRTINGARRLCYLFIEARSIRDSLYGVGTNVGPHEFVTTHYRRFVDPANLKERLADLFEITYFAEDRGFAKTQTEDPCLIRLIARKRA